MGPIMIVEDEDAIARVLAAYVRKAGYESLVCNDGSQALASFDEAKPGLVLLDVMLPGTDGWEVLRGIRAKGSCPVIMLTARGEVGDRIRGLNGGADDYIAKPFEPEEVVARIQAVLRRPAQSLVGRDQIVFGSLRIDRQSRGVYLNGALLSVTPRDLSLLLFLAEHPNRIFEREQLIEKVWGIDYEGSDRAVDLSVKRLRSLLLHWPAEEGEIRTLRGTGYQLHANTNR
ncbi:DNA-binding response regulator, OmpR family, contains REC and winged-helix (wHTH) domain [Cohnella sp. OV330]|uniref:response regulator n=1 Tax=Cohnella sp. OV330 TaxID=1855288 RepID=UPI0008F037E0|nr:response regulator transcription factor [Cohnella sp. OV330]SFB28786.1 DNA-binding response regulator, OmpR family, contains REC and winged-helix (wHTH) domain [Cohnella sp. OV330]